MKKRFLSMLALLLMAATGAWADTTVTWTASDMSELYIDFEDGEVMNNTIKGITATGSTGGDGEWFGGDIDSGNGDNTITFTSSVGNIKSIEINAEGINMMSLPAGWTVSDGFKKLSWSGEASSTVSLTFSSWETIENISEIVFTIESTPAATYIVAGSNAEIFGYSWDGSYEANKMTKGGDGKYTKTYNVEDAVDDIQLKVVKDGMDWIGDETGNNVTFSMKQAGSFTVTIDPNANPVCVTVTGDNVVFANTEYAINYATGMQNGTVTGPDAAKEDDEVTLTITPAAGCVLESISVTGVTTENAVEVTDGKFTMPAEDVNVIATFKLVTYAITLAEGTEDATNWTISPAEAAEGSPVTVTYSGERKVKSVKAVKKAAAPASGTDLATITADYEAKDGETLTGTLGSNVKISIADGATVTLKDVDINGSGTWTSGDYAGITCAGDATITLEGTNTVKGFVDIYPGIFVSSGKTLVINGTGELNASSNTGTGGAGIGGGDQMNCGNIEIQSGTVTAIGNEYGAGIGGGHNANCGDITISGGKVTATGGYRAAGIGGGRRGSSGTKDEYDSGSCGNITISGGTITAKGGEAAAGIGGGRGNTIYYKSSCGTITITSGVTSVTATKGSDDAQSIGAGYLGTCGAVNIENGANVTMGPITVTWNSPSFDGNTYTQDGVTCTPSNGDAASGNCFYDYGDNTFTTTLGKFTKIEIVCTSGDIDGWTKEAAGQYQPDPVAHPDRWKNLYKLTWTGDAESLTIQKDVYGIQSITFNIQ